MGGSKQPSQTTQVVKNEIDPTIKPYLEFGLGQAKDLYNQGPVPYYPSSTVVPFSPETEQALQLQSQLAGNIGGRLETGIGELEKTAAGGYLGSNPALQSAIDAASRGIARNYRESVAPTVESQFARAGRFGSGAHESARARSEAELATQLGDVSARITAADYESERARQQAAAQALPSSLSSLQVPADILSKVGATREALSGAQLGEDIARYQAEQYGPAQTLDEYLARVQGIAPSFGSSQYSTGTGAYSGQNRGLSALGGAATGAGLASTLGLTAGPTSGLAALGLGGALGPIAVGGLLGGALGLFG